MRVADPWGVRVVHMVVLRECQVSTAACDRFCLPLPQLGVTTSIVEFTVEEGDRSLGCRVDVVLKGQSMPLLT